MNSDNKCMDQKDIIDDIQKDIIDDIFNIFDIIPDDLNFPEDIFEDHCEKSQVICECPICFEPIGDKNNITTECGHKFHANCLMTNISCNGFSCPCCRTVMIEKEQNEHEDEHEDGYEDGYEDDENTSSEYSDESQDTSSEYSDESQDAFSRPIRGSNIEPHGTDMLRGFRLFTNLIENEVPDPIDVREEFQNLDSRLLPSNEYIKEKLLEEGITTDQLIATLLKFTHIDKYYYNDSNAAIYKFVTDKFFEILSDYDAEEELHPNVTVRTRQNGNKDLDDIRIDLDTLFSEVDNV